MECLAVLEEERLVSEMVERGGKCFCGDAGERVVEVVDVENVFFDAKGSFLLKNKCTRLLKDPEWPPLGELGTRVGS